MAENDGQQDNLSPMDRVEAYLAKSPAEHEAFNREYEALMRRQRQLLRSLEEDKRNRLSHGTGQ